MPAGCSVRWATRTPARETVTTTVFFVRHVPHEHQDRVHVGRMDGVKLRADSVDRLARISRRFAPERLDAVYASPVSRAQLTAHAIAEPLGLEVRTDPRLTEIDTGDWTGRTVAEVDAEPATHAWNTVRSLNRIPGGESMLEVQARMVRALEAITAAHPDQRVAVVSHGDPTKSVLLYLLGMPLDAHARIDVDTGSVSVASVGDWGAKVHVLNDTAHFRTEPANT